MNEYTGAQSPVAYADADTRGRFINRVYMHVALAILVFTGVEVFLFQSGLAVPIAQAMLGVPWLLILGAFMLVGWFATRTAHRITSPATQYGALALYVVAYAILFVPMLVLAQYKAQQTGVDIISSAAWATLAGVGGLTLVAFVTGKDFSFLRGLLMWGGILALIAIVLAVIFGWQLGTWFSVAMIGFAGAAVLYDTSNILHHYPEDKYVAAALQLFGSIALMFWYVLRLFMSRH